MAEEEKKEKLDTSKEQETQQQQNTSDNKENRDSVWEKRYKDAQSELTRSQQELQQYREYLQQTQQPQQEEEEDGFVTKKDLEAVRRQVASSKGEAYFYSKYPDMADYEPMVSSFIRKTDSRLSTMERIDKAVGMVKERLDAVREEGKTEAQKSHEEQQKKEAETEGFDSASSAEQEQQRQKQKNESETETAEDWIKWRKSQERNRR